MEKLILWDIDNLEQHFTKLQYIVAEMNNYMEDIKSMKIINSAGDVVINLNNINEEIISNISCRIDIMNGIINYLKIKREALIEYDTGVF